ncbi:Protein of unknown function DUF126 [Xenorhabdus japonica]|uniref:Phosphomevalonate dehydratase small subunit-like domain-containing protein n=1 Tax=Xenorhabdus japonica TaxID=53341 RepID=A0A1I5EDX5_9GAMM|nr:DUF126 domain-containing protein [Xenorhabdus japonica]SFO09610.1 Protein of unknown function DUF126 [Xenorhabdus japonica]
MKLTEDENQAIVINHSFSFIGDYDFNTGQLLIHEHDYYRQSIAGKVLVCTEGKGGTMASFLDSHIKRNTVMNEVNEWVFL